MHGTRSASLVLGAVFWTALSVGAPALSAQDEVDDRPGVGVLPFVNGGSYGDDPQDYDRLQAGMQQFFMTALSFISDLRLVERGQLQALMDEQDLPADRVTAQTAAAIGDITGAKYMIMGGFIDLNGDINLNARVVDTETTEIVFARRERGDRDDLFDLMEGLAAQVAEAAEFPPLPEAERGADRGEQEAPSYRAMTRYSAVVMLKDQGRHEEADELLDTLQKEFPGIVEYAQALEQTG